MDRGRAFCGAAMALGMAMTAPAIAADAPTDADMRRAMRDEIARQVIQCAVRNNKAGYNADGLLNFRSFLDNVTARGSIDRMNGTVHFKIDSVPNTEMELVIYLNEDHSRMREFTVITEKVTKKKVRTGTLLDPKFEDGEDREVTFDLRCTTQPRR